MSRISKAKEALVLVGVFTLLLLPACGPVNAGTSTAREFEEWMKNTPGVASVKASGQNTLPWAGSADGEIVTDGPLSKSQYVELVEKGLAFESSQSWGFTLDANTGKLETSVSYSPSSDKVTEVIDFIYDTSFEGINSLSISSLEPVSVSVTGENFLTNFDQIKSKLDFASLPHNFIHSTTEDGNKSITSAVPGDVDDARKGIEELSKIYDVKGVTIEPDLTTVRLPAPYSPEPAKVLSQFLPSEEINVQFGSVERTPGDDVKALEPMIAAAENSGLLLGASASSAGAIWKTSTVFDTINLDRSLSSQPGYEEYDMTFISEDGYALTPQTTSSGKMIVNVQAISEMATDPELSSQIEEFRSNKKGVTLQVKDMNASPQLLAHHLKAVSQPGKEVSLFLSTDFRFTFEGEPSFDTGEMIDFAIADSKNNRKFVTSFIEAWKRS